MADVGYVAMTSLRDDGIDVALDTRLSNKHPRFEEIMLRHRGAIDRGEPSYKDPASGLTVMTARFLADRGYCCLSGCRHCPFVQER